MKNKKVTILIGPSGSGKSTYAKNFVQKNENYCIVSRDDFRYAFQNKGVVDFKLEETITKLVKHTTKQLLSDGFNILYDATNLKAKYIEQYISHVRYLADVEFYILNTPLETCIERDSKRERKVGQEVIERQWKDFIVLMDSFDFTPRKKERKIVEYKIDRTKKSCFVYDLDGTLAHTNGKRHIFDFKEVEKDDVDFAVLQILKAVQQQPEHPYTLIVSGRSDECKEETKKWLEKNKIRYDGLYMRKQGDNRKDSIVKEEIYNNDILPYFNVIGVFDDRQQVVDKIRDMGIKVFQVEEGLF